MSFDFLRRKSRFQEDIVELADRCPQPRHPDLAFGCQVNPAGGALQQPHPHLIFQAIDALADDRGHDTKLSRCGSQAARLRDQQKGLDIQYSIHGWLPRKRTVATPTLFANRENCTTRIADLFPGYESAKPKRPVNPARTLLTG